MVQEFHGLICGCCGAMFTQGQQEEAIEHAGMVCGPVLRLTDEIGTPNDGQPCPHEHRDWLGNSR